MERGPLDKSTVGEVIGFGEHLVANVEYMGRLCVTTVPAHEIEESGVSLQTGDCFDAEEVYLKGPFTVAIRGAITPIETFGRSVDELVGRP